MVLGQWTAVLVGNLWYCVSIGGHWLVIGGGTGSVKGCYACTYWKSGNLVGCYHSGTTTNEKGRIELLSQWPMDGGLRWATKHKQLVLFFRVIGLSTITNAMAVIKMKIFFRYKKGRGAPMRSEQWFSTTDRVPQWDWQRIFWKKDSHAQIPLHQKQKQNMRWNGCALSTFPCCEKWPDELGRLSKTT